MFNFAAFVPLVLWFVCGLVNAKGGGKGGGGKFRGGGGGGGGGGGTPEERKRLAIILGSIFGGLFLLGVIWCVWKYRSENKKRKVSTTAARDVEFVTEEPKAVATWKDKLLFFKTPKRNSTLPKPVTEGQEKQSLLSPFGLLNKTKSSLADANSFVSETSTAVDNTPSERKD